MQSLSQYNVFLSTYICRNMSWSLGEWEMLWQHKTIGKCFHSFFWLQKPKKKKQKTACLLWSSKCKIILFACAITVSTTCAGSALLLSFSIKSTGRVFYHKCYPLIKIYWCCITNAIHWLKSTGVLSQMLIVSSD